jgi:hypothetical protein
VLVHARLGPLGAPWVDALDSLRRWREPKGSHSATEEQGSRTSCAVVVAPRTAVTTPTYGPWRAWRSHNVAAPPPSCQSLGRCQPIIAALDRDLVGCYRAPNTCRARQNRLFYFVRAACATQRPATRAPDLFRATFTLARHAGWTANVLEQAGDSRLVLPDIRNIGSPERDPPSA